MPALRKRKSRTGTPLATANNSPSNGFDARDHKMQSSLDAWVEPALQNPAPSFEEHGFARHGVLETMAPLGVPPSSRVKQKARANGEPTTRGSLLGGKVNAFEEDDEATTPEMTSVPELERDDSEMQEEDSHNTLLEPEEEEDDDYKPVKKKQKTSHGAKTPVRGKAVAAPSKTPTSAKTHGKNGTSKSVSTSSKPMFEGAGPQGLDPATQQRIQIAVNDAISRSNKHNNRNLGIALRLMLEESKEDRNLAKSLDGVIHQKETAEDWSLFREFIKTAKKDIKRTFRMKAAMDAARAAKKSQGTSVSGEALSPAADTRPATKKSSPPKKDADLPAESRGHTLPNGTDRKASKQEVVDPADPAKIAPNPLSNAPTLKQKLSRSPWSARPPDDRWESALQFDEDGNPIIAPTAGTVEVKAGGSDSALSDVDEELLNHGSPVKPVKANNPGLVAMQKKIRSAALARAAKSSRSNSLKPFTKHKEKLPLTAEELAAQQEIEKIRQRFLDEQHGIRTEMLGFAPISDTRFDDELLETESLTESQIELGPPTQNERQRRTTGRLLRNGTSHQATGTKRRQQESDEPRVSSPLTDSATTTRPTTPAAISHVPNNKRVKLNNGQGRQAARTKRSPVKNRDGPIAGIPHHGGGSRQLGPDDNDPESSPSESDDICSACKGAGEFVCCDHCPRVFHFICCDPPRLDAPLGSFSCHACSSKARTFEEPSEEKHAHLAPLFKSLESTNARAFALPADVQGFFEGVAARADGSYLEETKKLPLAKNSGYGYQRPDYTRQFDAEHNPILCAQCSQTSGGKRQMLKCDFCPSHWHLDCLDPPLANPPHINLDSTTRDAWRCPRHIEHEYRSGLVVQNDLNGAGDAFRIDAPAARLGRKVRKPRNPEIIQQTFTRGMRNNGLIDIINDPDDETDGEGNYVFGEEKDLNSQIYRVPEKGLVLDFLTKVKASRVEKKRTSRAASQVPAPAPIPKASMQDFASRSIKQQQAALNLAKLAQQEAAIGLNENTIDALIMGLTAEAPNSVVTAMTKAPLPPVDADERAVLEKLQQLIGLRLRG